VTRGLRYVSLRYFNAAGASFDGRIGEDWTFSINLIPLVMKAVLLGEPVRVFGTDYPTPDGTAIRDYIHVVDLADAHLRALEATAPNDPRIPDGLLVCNLGNGIGSSNLEVIAAAEAVVGVPVPYDVGPRRPGDPPVLVASSRRAEELLGWGPRRPTLAQMIGSAWAWRQANPDGYPD
jgi:UDP-glucose 4-epimerase